MSVKTSGRHSNSGRTMKTIDRTCSHAAPKKGCASLVETPAGASLVSELHRALVQGADACAIAVTETAGERTYGELLERSLQIAALLDREASTGDEPIGIAMRCGFNYIACVLGVLWTGRAFVPVDPSYPPQRVSHILRDSTASCVLHDATVSKGIIDQYQTPFIQIEDFSDKWKKSPRLEAVDRTIYTIYTSGTTGLPKGVPILASGLHNFLVEQGKYLRVSRDSVFAATSSISFDMSIWEVFLALMHQARIVALDRETIIDGRCLGNSLVRHRVTHILMTPSMLSTLPKIQYPDLKHVVSAGEKCSLALIEFWSEACSFHDAYGATEATIYTTITRKTKHTHPGDVGRAMPGNDVLVVNEELKPVANGEDGEICIGGVGVSPGYQNRPELNCEKFVWINQRRYYRTGDVGSAAANGALLFRGRKDKQVKLNGFRIELEEIESVSNRTGLIESCHAALLCTQSDLSMLILFVVPRDGGPFSAAALKTRLGEFLPSYMVPNRIVAVGNLPLTVNGKVDSAALLSAIN